MLERYIRSHYYYDYYCYYYCYPNFEQMKSLAVFSCSNARVSVRQLLVFKNNLGILACVLQREVNTSD